MQGVAELVEHGLGVVPGEQHGLAGLGLDEVRVVGDDGDHRPGQFLLLAIGVHPGAGILARPGEGVEVPDADHRVVAVANLIDRHVGMEDRHAFDLLEGEAVQLARREEHGLADVVQLEVGLELVEIEVVLGLAQLLGVVAVVPGGELVAAVLGVHQLLHRRHVHLHLGDGGGDRLGQEVHGVLRILGHGVGEVPVRIGRIAVELRPFGPKLQDLGDHGIVVVGARVIPAGGPHAEGLFPQ